MQLQICFVVVVIAPLSHEKFAGDIFNITHFQIYGRREHAVVNREIEHWEDVKHVVCLHTHTTCSCQYQAAV